MTDSNPPPLQGEGALHKTTRDAIIRLSSQDRQSIAINGIFVLLTVYTLHFASAILIPVTVAILLTLLLSRPVRLLKQIGVPTPVGALLAVLVVSALMLGAVYLMSGPAQSWIERVPQSLEKIETKLRPIKKPIEKTEEALRKMEEAAEIGENSKVQKVEIENSSLLSNLFTGTPQIMASTGSTILLLLFLLASGDTFTRKLVAASPTLTEKKRAIEITRNVQDDISFYLLTITLLNTAIGSVTTTYCYLTGIQDPLLWGALAALFGFVPFLGPALMTAILTVVGMISFDSLIVSLGAPAVYLTAVFVCNSLVLPIVLGRRLTLNPVAIFLAIMFWGWLWGVAGILLAVPVLASFKVVCERIEPLQPVAEFLTP